MMDKKKATTKQQSLEKQNRYVRGECLSMEQSNRAMSATLYESIHRKRPSLIRCALSCSQHLAVSLHRAGQTGGSISSLSAWQFPPLLTLFTFSAVVLHCVCSHSSSRSLSIHILPLFLSLYIYIFIRILSTHPPTHLISIVIVLHP